MKFFLKIDSRQEPSVVVTCAKVSATVKKIEELCSSEVEEDLLYGFEGDDIVPLERAEIICFFTKENRVYAFVEEKEYLVKYRIKDLVEKLDDCFIKINQGCIANVNHIKKFSASLGGALNVTFRNGYVDYVSRRESINIKRRFGL